jgi:hypothetical protein
MAGILLIGAYGLVHLVEAPEHYEGTPYVGCLFVANFAGAIPTMVGIYQDRLWGWLLGVLAAGGASGMFVVSPLFGLPGYKDHLGMWLGDSFEDNLGTPSLLVEAPFITLFLMVAAKYTTGHVKRAANRHEKGDSRVL